MEKFFLLLAVQEVHACAFGGALRPVRRVRNGWVGKKPESFSMPAAEYSFSVTESSAAPVISAAVCEQANATGEGIEARSVVPSPPTLLEQSGRLGAPPKLGSEQAPIELQTAYADEAMSAQKRLGRNQTRGGKLSGNSKEAIHKPVDYPSS